MLKRIIIVVAILFNSMVINAQSTLNIRAFIEGYFDSLTMVPVIDPINQPSLFDTIQVELHETSSGNLAFSTFCIFDIYGNGTVTVPPIYFGNSYYIALKHRNSIETWSATSIYITNISSYDFTTGVSQAYGNNMVLVDSVSCIYSGDINQDGYIDIFDFLLLDYDIQNAVAGNYLITDLNGDGFADAFDFLILDINIQLGIGIMVPVFTSIDNATNNYSSDLIVFPNPAHESFKVDTKSLNKYYQIFIYSITGKLLYSSNYYQSSSPIYINSFDVGNYIIQLTDENQMAQYKLFVKN